jgi:hypothetical protein
MAKLNNPTFPERMRVAMAGVIDERSLLNFACRITNTKRSY